MPFFTGWWQKTCQVVGCHLWAWRKESVSNYKFYILLWHVSVTITFIIHHKLTCVSNYELYITHWRVTVITITYYIHHTLMCVSNMSNYNINYTLKRNHQRFVQKQNIIINICKYSEQKKSLFCLSAWMYY